MPFRNLGPNGAGLLRREEVERDRVARRGDCREDVVTVGTLSARPTNRGDREGLEAVGQEADRAFVAGGGGHSEEDPERHRSLTVGRAAYPPAGGLLP